jgi:hypothetical protein
VAAQSALEAATNGTLFAAWDPANPQTVLQPGMKVMFFGSAAGCDGAHDGPLTSVSDIQLANASAMSGMAATATPPNYRWTPAGASTACNASAQSLSGSSMVYLNPDATAGGVALLTTSGPQPDGTSPFFAPYGATGQNGAGANANISGTFVNFRQQRTATNPLQPWFGGGAARVRSVQSVGTFGLDASAQSNQVLQAKQQMSVTFFNPTCFTQLSAVGKPCQIQYVFNTAIARNGVSDWSNVAWFQNGSLFFDPGQGGIPVVNGPVQAAGVTTNDTATGLPLYTSQGQPTQHQPFKEVAFDLNIDFLQLTNAMRLVAAATLSVDAAAVTNDQMSAVWGTSWNDPSAWILLTSAIGQEVYNPYPTLKASIGGGFSSLYVGPQS